MKIHDSDIKSPTQGDKDLSLNYKSSAVAAVSSIDIQDAVRHIKNFLRDISQSISNAFAIAAESQYIEPALSGLFDKEQMKRVLAELEGIPSNTKKAAKSALFDLKGADTDDVSDIVAALWPSDSPRAWDLRAGLISAIESAIDSSNIPESVKIPILHGNTKDPILDKRLLRRLAKPPSKNRDVDPDTLAKLSALSAALRIVRENPTAVDANKIDAAAKSFSATLRQRVSDIQELEDIVDSWFTAMSSIKHEEGGVRELTGTKDLNKVISDLEGFLEDQKAVDPTRYMKELEHYSKSKYQDIPPEVEGMFDGFKRAAASNEKFQVGIMAERIATYHGVVDVRGNPTDPPNTDYLSYPSRWFDDRHFDSILKHAKTLLAENDWIKYGWEGGAEDAQFRAALDLSIQTADNNLYQNKIDVDTYNMLLNRLAGWGHDTFSETVLPMKAAKRSAASMIRQTHEYQNLVRIASSLRETDPRSALEIMKSLRSMVSTEASSQPISKVALEPMPSEDEHTSGQNEELEHDEAPEGETAAPLGVHPGDTINLKSLSDDDINHLKQISDKFRSEAEKFLDEADIDHFMQGFDDLVQGKTASAASIPLPILLRLASSSEAAKAVLGPFILAAAKKNKKKGGKGKPKSKPGKGDKKDAKPGKGKIPDMGGKAAPPFKKKASVAFSAEDVSW
jgi:hypothetical protein